MTQPRPGLRSVLQEEQHRTKLRLPHCHPLLQPCSMDTETRRSLLIDRYRENLRKAERLEHRITWIRGDESSPEYREIRESLAALEADSNAIRIELNKIRLAFGFTGIRN